MTADVKPHRYKPEHDSNDEVTAVVTLLVLKYRGRLESVGRSGRSDKPKRKAVIMETSIENYLDSLRLGEAQVYRNIILFPLRTPVNGSPTYLTLDEAIQARTLTVTEISQAGSVPELFVVNQGDQPVLLLDGEELLGAKQNRVLNTSILLRQKSETKIPVSCTEHGRWAYSSAQFLSSDVIMEKKIRARKSQTVSESLVSGLSFRSDQGQVWAGIAALQAKSGSHSPTGAMQDTYKNYANELKTCLEAFPQLPDQQGILVVINGRVEGFDVISRAEAYGHLHAKLVRSYVLEGLLERRKVECDPPQALAEARAFLASLAHAKETKFQSIGYGWDFRFNGNQVAGNVLVHEDHVIHAAFFRMDPTENQSPMASLRQRRHRFAA
jgi:hypothetical protein